MKRSFDLPDYESPPLSEVALGVQFITPKGYQQIYAKEVWDLFINDFPKIKEVNALPPSFETFGLPNFKGSKIELKTGAKHDRFWFITEDDSELLQFQQDRLLHNWRKINGNNASYPRFEKIVKKYKLELFKLNEYLSEKFAIKSLEIDQCELTYVNLIEVTDSNELIHDWIKIINPIDIEFENISFTTQKTLKRESGEPFARLTCFCNKTIGIGGKPTIELRITVKGAPEEANIDGAIGFLTNARNEIVFCFDEITTVYAHNIWGKR